MNPESTASHSGRTMACQTQAAPIAGLLTSLRDGGFESRMERTVTLEMSLSEIFDRG